MLTKLTFAMTFFILISGCRLRTPTSGIKDDVTTPKKYVTTDTAVTEDPETNQLNPDLRVPFIEAQVEIIQKIQNQYNRWYTVEQLTDAFIKKKLETLAVRDSETNKVVGYILYEVVNDALIKIHDVGVDLDLKRFEKTVILEDLKNMIRQKSQNSKLPVGMSIYGAHRKHIDILKESFGMKAVNIAENKRANANNAELNQAYGDEYYVSNYNKESVEEASKTLAANENAEGGALNYSDLQTINPDSEAIIEQAVPDARVHFRDSPFFNEFDKVDPQSARRIVYAFSLSFEGLGGVKLDGKSILLRALKGAGKSFTSDNTMAMLARAKFPNEISDHLFHKSLEDKTYIKDFTQTQVDELKQRIFNDLEKIDLRILDSVNLKSNTSYRGQLETRIAAILKKANTGNRPIVFHTDEVHKLMDKGENGVSDGIFEQLKNAMSAGRVKLIAATTTEEFYQYIWPNEALVDRFSLFDIEPISDDIIVKVIENDLIKLRDKGVTIIEPEKIAAEILKQSRVMDPNAGVVRGPRDLMGTFQSQTKFFDSPKGEVVDINTARSFLSNYFGTKGIIFEAKNLQQRVSEKIAGFEGTSDSLKADLSTKLTSIAVNVITGVNTNNYRAKLSVFQGEKGSGQIEHSQLVADILGRNVLKVNVSGRSNLDYIKQEIIKFVGDSKNGGAVGILQFNGFQLLSAIDQQEVMKWMSQGYIHDEKGARKIYFPGLSAHFILEGDISTSTKELLNEHTFNRNTLTLQERTVESRESQITKYIENLVTNKILSQKALALLGSSETRKKYTETYLDINKPNIKQVKADTDDLENKSLIDDPNKAIVDKASLDNEFEDIRGQIEDMASLEVDSDSIEIYMRETACSLGK